MAGSTALPDGTTHRDLVGDDASRAEFDAYLLRPPRIEVAQPKVTYFALRAKLGEVLEGGDVAPVLVILPKELPAPQSIMPPQ